MVHSKDTLVLTEFNNEATTAHNRAYLASCLRHYTQIPLRRTSDTLKTSAIARSQETDRFIKMIQPNLKREDKNEWIH